MRFLVILFFRKAAHNIPSRVLCAVRLCGFSCFLDDNFVTLVSSPLILKACGLSSGNVDTLTYFLHFSTPE